MPDYDFSAAWLLDVRSEQAWPLLADPARWPEWWPGCRRVDEVSAGRDRGIGARYRFLWQGRLPQALTMEVELTEVKPLHRLGGEVTGVLTGTVVWQLEEVGGRTQAAFRMRASGREPWMRPWAPVTRQPFHRNFRGLMEAGRQGLARKLGVDTWPAD